MLVNHVLSGPPSPIFSDLLDRFRAYDSSMVSSSAPVDNADLYVYWRPHKVSEVKGPAIAWHHADLTQDCKAHSLQNIDVGLFNHHICLNRTHQFEDLNYWGVPADKISVVHHSYDKRLLGVEKSKSDILRIAFLSNRYGRKVKGEDLLVKVFARLQSVAPSIEFIFVGKDRDIERDIALAHGFNARYLMFTNYEDYIRLYGEIDVLLVLSKCEGGPASLPEGCAANCFVLSTKCGMAPDIGIGMDESEILATVNNIAVSGVDKFKEYLSTYKNPYIDKLTTWEQAIENHYQVYKKVLDMAR